MDSLVKRIDFQRFSDWMRLKYVTARILKLYKRYKRAETQENLIILPEDLDRAEDF